MNEVLNSIQYIDEGIERLIRLSSWPSRTIPEASREAIDALTEFFTFVVATKLPFYKIIDTVFKNDIFKLYQYIESKGSVIDGKLTYKEAFYLLRCIGSKNTLFILE